MVSPKFKRAMERRRARAKKRGIALIMVLGAITIMTVFLTELQTDTTAAVAGALAERDRLKAEYYAKSAVNLARLLLGSEKQISQEVGAIVQLLLQTQKAPQIPVWEFSDQVLGAFNGGGRATVFGTKIGVDVSTGKNIGIPGNGYFDLTIVDEDSKFNLNSATAAINPQMLMLQMQALFAQPQYVTMFEQPDGDKQISDPMTLCASIVDWADPDENLANCDPKSTTAGSGTEDNIYQMLGLSYRRKNAPFDSLEEVRLVRGMDDDRWTTFIDPSPNDPHKRNVTVWGQDSTAINVNTANPQSLWVSACSMADPLNSPTCTDPLQAASFIQIFTLVRTLVRGVPLFGTWKDFKNLCEGKGMIGGLLAGMGVTPIKFDSRFKTRDFKKVFKVESKVFGIYAEGVVPGTKREARVRIHAVLDMRAADPWKSVDPAQLANGQGTPGQPPAGNQQMTDAQEAQMDQNEFLKEVSTNPFGQIVYYRVD